MDLAEALQHNDRVVVAERVFPEQKYRWRFDRNSIQITLKDLSKKGFTFDCGYEMDAKKSDYVITVTGQPIVELKATAKKLETQ